MTFWQGEENQECTPPKVSLPAGQPKNVHEIIVLFIIF